MRIKVIVMKIVFGFLIWLSASCSFAEPIAEYIHMPLKGESFAIDSDTNSVYITDIGYDAKFCNSADDYYCVVSKVLEFAVPKKLPFEDAWTYNSQSYKVIQKLSLRGEFPAFVIEKTGKTTFWYLWSSHRGLIMFGAERKEVAETKAGVFMLDGICGFAASSDCYSAQNNFYKK